jgi:pyruvate, water dikinase
VTPPVTPLVVDLADLGRDDVALAGGKGASLGELLRAGIRVPPGFVVATGAFRSAVAALDLGARVAALDPDDGAAVRDACADLRAAVESAPLPADVVEAVAGAYRQLAGPEDDPPVAVRSSATGEDGAADSFAGVQDTYLRVRGEEAVLRDVRRCWASLYGVDSVTYRLRRGIPETDLAMAVVVQRMVDARSAGVMFTRSPRTGDRSVVAIDASWGLGSAVVGGDVTPDSFVASKVTGEITRRTVATKLRRHEPDPAGEGVVESDVPDELRDVPAVTDEEIGELVALARRVEAHHGCAQDVEWAIDADGIVLLQSRPETVWAAKDAAAPTTAAPAARAFDHVLHALGGARRTEA